MDADLKKRFQFEFQYWIPVMGSFPIKIIKSIDISESYDMMRAHIFELENGQFALVTEEGCSCYNYENALIDLYPNKEIAIDKLNQWEKEKGEYR